jgi:protein SCO1
MGCLVQKIALIQWIAFLFVSVLIASCEERSSLPYYNTPSFDPQFIDDPDEVATKISHQIADFSFTDQHNQNITDEDVEGKIHVANFIFSSCVSICPKMTNHMKRISDAFSSDDEVVILSFSVTPWIDSVGRLREYASENGITSLNWHLLTGNTASIYKLARQSYFAEEQMGFTKDSTEFLHTEHFLLVDGTKRIRGIYNGTLELEIDQLISDIKSLKLTSAGKD